MKSRSRVAEILWDYGVILASCVLYAFAFNCFFDANRFAMGGFTGICQILNRISGGVIPVGTAVFVLNLPLILAGFKKQGVKLLFATLFAITASSLMIDGLGMVYTFYPLEDPLLSCIFGGVLLGVSLGLMLRKSATTGGTELLARLLKYRFRHLSIGRLCLIIDLLVVSAYALVFREWLGAMYGVIAMFISSKVMDTVIYGSINAKLAIIISDHSQAITQKLLEMELGVTILSGKGAWTGNAKNVIMCVFRQNHIAAIKAAATALDASVFFIVCDAREVLGEGFGEYSEDSL